MKGQNARSLSEANKIVLSRPINKQVSRVQKKTRNDMTQKNQLTPIKTIERNNAQQYGKEKDENDKSFGYKNMPLTDIPFIDCVVDPLHLWQRITDKLEA
jgi:hypothetical protein